MITVNRLVCRVPNNIDGLLLKKLKQYSIQALDAKGLHDITTV